MTEEVWCRNVVGWAWPDDLPVSQCMGNGADWLFLQVLRSEGGQPQAVPKLGVPLALAPVGWELHRLYCLRQASLSETACPVAVALLGGSKKK